MKKYESLIILSQLNPNDKVRLIIDMPYLGVDSMDTVGAHIYFLEKTYIPEDENVIQLESNSFDFALAYNSVFNVESTNDVEYTDEQKEMMLSCEYEKQFLTNSI